MPPEARDWKVPPPPMMRCQSPLLMPMRRRRYSADVTQPGLYALTVTRSVRLIVNGPTSDAGSGKSPSRSRVGVGRENADEYVAKFAGIVDRGHEIGPRRRHAGHVREVPPVSLRHYPLVGKLTSIGCAQEVQSRDTGGYLVLLHCPARDRALPGNRRDDGSLERRGFPEPVGDRACHLPPTRPERHRRRHPACASWAWRWTPPPPRTRPSCTCTGSP